MIVTKEGYFEAAHMLSNYDGRCANLHGHSYKYEITVATESDVVDGMVIDFNRIKAVVDRYDHATVFAGEYARDRAEQELLDWAETWDKRRVYMPARQKPTCENMASQLATEVFDALPDSIKSSSTLVVTVSLWETRTGHASLSVRRSKV